MHIGKHAQFIQMTVETGIGNSIGIKRKNAPLESCKIAFKGIFWFQKSVLEVVFFGFNIIFDHMRVHVLNVGSTMGCQVGKKHLLFTYMAIIFSLMDVIFYHIGTI